MGVKMNYEPTITLGSMSTLVGVLVAVGVAYGSLMERMDRQERSLELIGELHISTAELAIRQESIRESREAERERVQILVNALERRISAIEEDHREFDKKIGGAR